MTLEDDIEFENPCWETFSDECKDLILKMLCRDPVFRINLDDALKHPWFSDIEVNEDTDMIVNTK